MPGGRPLANPPPRRHHARVLRFLGQDPAPIAQAPDPSLLEALQQIGWVDRTALAVLLVFFVIGLFKGLIWQVSRVAILVLAYYVAGQFGHPVADWLRQTPLATSAPETRPSVPPDAARPADAGAAEAVATTAPNEPVDASVVARPAASPEADTTLYLAYVLIFLVVLVLLSLLALALQKLVRSAGLGFFDRLGGGVLGVATGACIVLFGISLVHMFFRGSQLAEAAEHSHSLRLSQRAVAALGAVVPDDLRSVFDLAPLRPDAAPAAGPPPMTPVPADLPGDPEPPPPAPPTRLPATRVPATGGGR